MKRPATPPPENPWKDQPKACQMNYSVPKTLSKKPLPPSPEPEKRRKKPTPPTEPEVDRLKLIEDQLNNHPKPAEEPRFELENVKLNKGYLYKSQEPEPLMKMERVKLSSTGIKLTAEEQEKADAEWASGAVRACARVSKHMEDNEGYKKEEVKPVPEVNQRDYQGQFYTSYN